MLVTVIVRNLVKCINNRGGIKHISHAQWAGSHSSFPHSPIKHAGTFSGILFYHYYYQLFSFLQNTKISYRPLRSSGTLHFILGSSGTALHDNISLKKLSRSPEKTACLTLFTASCKSWHFIGTSTWSEGGSEPVILGRSNYLYTLSDVTRGSFPKKQKTNVF